MGVFEEFNEPVDESLFCAICHGVLERPLIFCIEGHTYCEACLAAWTAQRKSCCPECRRPPVAGGASVRNIAVERLIAKLVVKCGTCMWSGRLEHLKKHRDLECPHRLVPCRLKCGWIGRFSEEESHVLSSCRKYERECHNGCGATFALPAAAGADEAATPEAHYRDQCPLEPIPCIFAKFGCTARVTRSQQTAHQAEDAAAHEALCSATVSRLQDEIREKMRLLSASEEEIRHSQRRANMIEQELSDIRGVVDGRMPALLPGPGDVMVGDRALVQIRVHVWNVGDYIEVRDLHDDVWYPGSVTRVCPMRNTVKIHFLGFNSLWFDEEIRLDSGRLRIPQAEQRPPSDWRHELQVGDQVDVLDEGEQRRWLRGMVAMVNRSTGHLYVRVVDHPPLSRWVHSYSNEIRRPGSTSLTTTTTGRSSNNSSVIHNMSNSSGSTNLISTQTATDLLPAPPAQSLLGPTSSTIV